jgi:thymidylate kinase
MPTPMLSFAVRHLKCDAGIVITASHNPAKYNGYKAYGPDGCQLGPEAAEYVLSIMNNVDAFEGVKSLDFDTALKEGKIVLCDRYLDSSLAYQGGARGLGVDEILGINMFATEGTFPDTTLLFDIEPELGLARIAKNQNREVNRLDLEKIDFHHSVRNTFLALAKRYPNRFEVIDASLSYDEVFENALKVVLRRINEGK